MKGRCILQVEDEETDIFMLKWAFEKARVATPLVAVTDGHMALDYLSGTGDFGDRQKYPLPCVVLLDLKLPRMDGFEVLRWIRQRPDTAHLIVIVFSSSSHPDDVASAYRLGANAYLEKTTDANKMLEIAQLIDRWWIGYNRFALMPDNPARPE